MNLELISIETATIPLDGIAARSDPMVFHGNCHNFYIGPSRFMPKPLLAEGIACLAFNRRGHDMITSLGGRDIGGGSFQLAHEALADNRYAAQWLRARGFNDPIVIGHSNGGVLAAQYAVDHPEMPALTSADNVRTVLLSPGRLPRHSSRRSDLRQRMRFSDIS